MDKDGFFFRGLFFAFVLSVPLWLLIILAFVMLSEVVK